MLRKLSLKLFAILLLTAFICGISAVPAVAITISGTVITISKSGEEQCVGGGDGYAIQSNRKN